MNWQEYLRRLSWDDLQRELAKCSRWADYARSKLPTRQRKEAETKLRDVEREIAAREHEAENKS